jgi:hypothetical protein
MALDCRATCSGAQRCRGAKAVAAVVAILSMTVAMAGQAQGPPRTARVGLLLPGITQATAREAAGFLVFVTPLPSKAIVRGRISCSR